ncbi:hypothetical protein F4703DRAFT_1788286 [Phycomyces blakesleeanus]|uniref:Uncharacterized protein n=1 Tax=Phycomyces blakesleeanus (strain ATCC 8743b / DSM 1359 / FGSC 10004 / NBRC 33097 / NRRL 1555) TaxID=763407 RepID=A0A167QEJ4_PHYB8|nr:hypothetical protein PHYBLDRAFT_162644 [Phycomyces blakesleeanus NRRL 1555(-)]OAD79587.1 hypothetical protein PHYBLDRAFT_162644 [Phycomyces blakesleeanus NRRL 1555(-)]|eukprot:XP_018297627.1 hypothetical protein PHYBLDRAFT_162644 [Phycomyces blakesleeanus NRRL 1555(-)]
MFVWCASFECVTNLVLPWHPQQAKLVWKFVWSLTAENEKQFSGERCVSSAFLGIWCLSTVYNAFKLLPDLSPPKKYFLTIFSLPLRIFNIQLILSVKARYSDIFVLTFSSLAIPTFAIGLLKSIDISMNMGLLLVRQVPAIMDLLAIQLYLNVLINICAINFKQNLIGGYESDILFGFFTIITVKPVVYFSQCNWLNEYWYISRAQNLM